VAQVSAWDCRGAGVLVVVVLVFDTCAGGWGGGGGRQEINVLAALGTSHNSSGITLLAKQIRLSPDLTFAHVILACLLPSPAPPLPQHTQALPQPPP
jgi:hypothetical protein